MEAIEEFIQAKALSPGCKKMYRRTLLDLAETTPLLEARPEDSSAPATGCGTGKEAKR